MQDFFLRLIAKSGDAQEEERQSPEVRLAVYDSLLAPPQIISLTAEDFDELVGELSSRAYNHARERGGRIPFVVIREIVENLIHALFQDAVVTIMDNGNTIRISASGPGIRNKERAFLPGFTTATREMRGLSKAWGRGCPWHESSSRSWAERSPSRTTSSEERWSPSGSVRHLPPRRQHRRRLRSNSNRSYGRPGSPTGSARCSF